jgi:hypothetical protein
MPETPPQILIARVMAFFATGGMVTTHPLHIRDREEAAMQQILPLIMMVCPPRPMRLAL